MTKKEALTIALSTITDTDARATIESMIAQLSKPRKTSDEAKAAQSAKRKAATAAARAEYEAKFVPIVTSVLPTDAESAKTLPAIAEMVPDLTEGKIRALFKAMPGVQKIEKRGERIRYWIQK